MTGEHARYADWDAAYVLGALSTAERREFEDHVEGCDRCPTAIAELAPLPGLLGRVDPAAARLLIEQEQAATADHGTEFVQRVRRDARRRTRLRAGIAVGLAAAAVVAAAIAIPLALAPTGAETIEMTAVGGSRIVASVTLSARDWGTLLDLDCSYPAGGSGYWDYALVVTGSDGSESQLSTWRIAAGASARLSAAVALGIGDIRSVEIRDLRTGETVMRGEP